MEKLWIGIACVLILLVCALGFLLLKKKSGTKATKLDMKFPHKTLIYIDGMTCEHCAARVETAFLEKGNGGAKVNLEEKFVEIWSNGPLPQANASETIQNLGFIPVKFIVLK